MAVPLGPKPKRTLKDIDKWLNAEEIYKLITARTWPYKQTPDFYKTRDRALMALYFLTGGRNNEVVKLKKAQFIVQKEFVVIKGMHISKRAKKTIAKYGPKVTMREPIYLPRFKSLEPFTQLIINHLEQLKGDPEQKLFLFGTRRSHQIIKFVTGKWVHWFRSMSENFYGEIFGDAVKLAKFIGVTNVQSVMPYIPLDKKAYKRDLKEKT